MTVLGKGIMTLIVKCPECGQDNDLGEQAHKLYNSSMAFGLSRKCIHCGIFFDETDTHEADYRTEVIHTWSCKYCGESEKPKCHKCVRDDGKIVTDELGS